MVPALAGPTRAGALLHNPCIHRNLGPEQLNHSQIDKSARTVRKGNQDRLKAPRNPLGSGVDRNRSLAL